MASSGNPNPNPNPNPNQQNHFDMNKLFKPTNLAPIQSSPQNPTTMAAPLTPSASYPPPTASPYPFPPQNHPSPPLPYYNQIPSQDLHHQRSVSFPTPPLQPHNPTPGARLMALLSNPPSDLNYSQQNATQPSSSDFSMASNVQPTPIRMPSRKLPRGRHIVGNHMVYDIDTRVQGEEQPQLEVTPITKYVSDPGLILGHQVAVNKTYICYGLKMGNIRVLNINTALRSLLRGHTQRVTDMAFFAEDVHLLASASIEGRVYVWKISEGPDEEEKPQISGHIVLAIHITGDEGFVHPRVCWHCHKQEILVVAIGKSVLRIDTTKVHKGVEFSAEEPFVCPLDKLINGVQLVGKHEGEVTDLSMCQWMTTRLVSASKDGTIKIWEDRKAQPLLVLRPHDGHPVDAAKFLTAPHRPDHIMLITAGPLNREVKLWASADEEGWLLPSDAESWRCIQTLELKSSVEAQSEEAFFNQVVALSHGGLLLLANAKKNAIYVIHLEYGANPAVTRMDYLAEFTVTMPILSFTGTSDILPHGEHLVQVYCVQTQAIQQYALDLSQCLPPPLDNLRLETSESDSRDAADGTPSLEPSASKSFEVPFSTAKPSISGVGSSSEVKGPVSAASDTTSIQEIIASNVDSNSVSLLSASSNADVASVPSPALPLSPRLTKKLSDLRSNQAPTDYPVDGQIDITQTSSSALPSSNYDNRAIQGNALDVVNPPVTFKHPTHLVTPFEIMATSSPDATRVSEKGDNDAKIQDVVLNNDKGNVEMDVKVVGETGFASNDESTRTADSQVITDRKEKSFFSQASDLGVDMSREYCALPSETSIMEEARNSIMEALAQPSNFCEEEGDETSNDVSGKAADFSVSTSVPQSSITVSKAKKNKGKNSQVTGSLCPSHSVSNSAELLQVPVSGSSVPLMEPNSQILAMHETLNQILAMQKEMQKQMSTVAAAPVVKEGKRLEAALGRSIEKNSKANTDALWARILEENAKLEKSLRGMTQIPGLISNIVNKELLAVLEKTLKKELPAVGTNVARVLSPAVEKTISSAITDSFQRGVGDKAASQLEKSVTSKLETTVARQIQVQFQTSGKQALQDGLRSCLEASIIPAFEMSCKAMFEQVNSAFQKGMAEHTTTATHQIESTNSQLALALRDALNSASSLTQTLSGELADNQRKLLALAAAGANSNSGNSLITQLSNGPLAGLHEKPFDPTKELSRLVSENKYEEAFTAALQRSDVSIVSWLCSQVDLQRLLSTIPLPLSQGVLLSLLQQLACDISKDTARKLAWMTDVATCINPHDPMIVVHVRPILEQVYQILNHQRSLLNNSFVELSSIRVVMHIVNSMLLTLK
ncbi:enhancer of mRNA-decapping protein 4-like isoform X2 [Amaranthus tricolor]|uniref:enhancer of mRNA-decapping protein 4-like isoform X2 n=1 Tax=Amaranthus tricolor TaxID=29722 RepID=UPI00258DDEDB|nr:enhancer of mRNA-decapping protein 4-like isoform X2 [Amaranthus tricolor]